MEKTKWYEEKYFEKLKRLDPITGRWYIPYGDIFGFVEQLITSVDVCLSAKQKVKLFKPPNLGLVRLTYTLYANMIASVGKDAENVTEAVRDWVIDTIYLMRQVLYIGDTMYEFAIRHIDECIRLILEIVHTAVMSHDVHVSEECMPILAKLLYENGLISEEMAKYLSEGFRLLVEKKDDRVCYVYWKFD